MSLLARAASKIMMPRATVARRMIASDNARYKAAMRQAWIGDVSTYPIITVITGACVGCVGYMAYKLTSCPDVRITSKAKGKILRTWA